MKLPIIVEFVGLPGAGKTTASNHILNELEKMGLKIWYRERDFGKEKKEIKIINMIVFIFFNLQFVFHLLKYFFQAHRFDIKSFRYLYSCLLLSTKIRCICMKKYDILLFDQGILQSLWSIYLFNQFSMNDRLVQSLLKKIYANKSILLYWFNVSVDTATSRILNRVANGSRFDGLDFANLKINLMKYKINLDALVHNAMKIKNTTVFAINSKAEQKVTIRRIKEDIIFLRYRKKI